MAAEHDQSVNADIRHIRSAAAEAKRSLAMYYRHQMRAIREGIVPENTTEVQEARMNVHISVLVLYQELRPYIRDKLDAYWDDEDAVLGGLKSLDTWNQPYRQDEEQVQSRHRGAETVQVVRPELYSLRTYQEVIQALEECRIKLNFAAQADTPAEEVEGPYDLLEDDDE